MDSGSNNMESSNNNEPAWFYELNGERKGAVSEAELAPMIKNGTLKRETSVWRKGLADWQSLENTALKQYLDDSTPPPLTGDRVNNTVVWVLAFGPLLGLMLEYVLAFIVYNGNELRAEIAVTSGNFFLVTVLLNIALSFLDEKKLEKAGTDTSQFKGWVWLVPVYLYQRAKHLKQNLAYFVVWLVCFALVLLGMV